MKSFAKLDCEDTVEIDFNPETKIFTAPQPYPSWTLNENRQWEPPVEYPDDGESHTWNEETQSWD